jgi:ribosomal protein S18 acetylase RimI-like enzyme
VLIRTFEESDRVAVIDLWRRAGLTRPWNDPDRDIDRKVADSPWGLLVGEDRGAVIAAVMVGYDGHRGSVNYLAVEPTCRGRGVGSALMDHAEWLVRERGCPKVALQVRGDNADVIAFYERRGYVVEPATHAVTLGRRLIEDAPAPPAPPAPSPQNLPHPKESP